MGEGLKADTGVEVHGKNTKQLRIKTSDPRGAALKTFSAYDDWVGVHVLPPVRLSICMSQRGISAQAAPRTPRPTPPWHRGPREQIFILLVPASSLLPPRRRSSVRSGGWLVG